MRTSQLRHRRPAAPSAPATRATVAVLGLLAAFTGVEHGLGEITQGPVKPPGPVFESWPHVHAFDPLDGEPAMSLIPNLLVTGLLAVAVAVVLGVWSVRFAGRRHGGTVLLGLALLLLLVGGGFGPPILGAVAGLLAGRILAVPRRAPGAVARCGARLWPWPLVVAVACFLGLFPGTTLLAALTGFHEPALVAALTLGAFLSTALATWTARAHDRVTASAYLSVPGSTPRLPEGPADRHTTLFRLWAGTWGTLLLVGFAAVTALTLTLWLTDPAYAQTTPDADLGFFALGATIAVGLLSQLHRPPPLAGLQQAVLATVALATTGLLAQRLEPLAGAGVILAVVAVPAWTHPARDQLLRVHRSPSPALAALALLAAIPAVAHTADLLALAREAGPSCFLGQCATGDRPAELAATALTVPLLGLLAALRTPGWRLPLWTTAAVAVTLGAAAALLPDRSTSLGTATGLAFVAWAMVFVWVAEREHRHRAPRPHTAHHGTPAWPSQAHHTHSPAPVEGAPP